MSRDVQKESSLCMQAINKIIDSSQSNKILQVAEFLLKKNVDLKDFYISCYETNYPDIRFTVNENNSPPKNRPFLVIRKQLEMNILLQKDRAKKYSFLIFTDSPKNFYKIKAPDGRQIKLETLKSLAHDAFVSRCISLNLDAPENIDLQLKNTASDHSIPTYEPSKSDVEQALRDLGGENILQDDLLKQVEANCIRKKLYLKDNWREITIRNIELWADKS